MSLLRIERNQKFQVLEKLSVPSSCLRIGKYVKKWTRRQIPNIASLGNGIYKEKGVTSSTLFMQCMQSINQVCCEEKIFLLGAEFPSPRGNGK
ncbi:hypothetical protein Plhal304r1_c041g0119431 [Plasmopara halstedii]